MASANSQNRTPGAFVSRLFYRESTLGPILLSPGFIFLLVMMAYPFVYAVFLSFTDKETGGPATFNGLENFQKLFSYGPFGRTVINSIVYTVFALALKFFGGLALASILNRPFIGQRYVKALMLLPWIMPTVFSTMIWQWILAPGFSVANIVLVEKLHIFAENLPFLRDERLAMASLIGINIWRGLPFFGITFLAAIQGVSLEILEAAKIDGASPWVAFWRVTFPIILPVVAVVVLISTIGTLGDFDLPFLLTRGGPNDATSLFSLLSFQLTFGSGRIGLGAAVTMTMFPLLSVLIVASLIMVRRRQKND
ncbi:MAG: sugar ABC transporter permease [Thermoflexales bacterium]